jgi:acyl-[acyl-carrier-protein] desaturase
VARWDIGTPYDALYKSFFDRAEQHRRWRLDRDIAWDGLAPEVPAELVEMAVTFWAVESFLPDYTAKVANTFRSDRARVWAHTMWSYEESKHARAFEEWLVRGGHRTEEQLNEFSSQMWNAGAWELPYETDRKFLVYQTLQESMTRLIYAQSRRHAEAIGDRALIDVLRHLASDEQAHHSFFKGCLRLWLDEDPEGTADDIYSVLLTFSMPVGKYVPDYADRIRMLADQDVGSPFLFATKVWLPLAKSLEIDPVPPPLRPMMEAGYEIDDIIAMFDPKQSETAPQRPETVSASAALA